MVFELRQIKSPKEYNVRVFYTAQTLDQLRDVTLRTLPTRLQRCSSLCPEAGNRLLRGATEGQAFFGFALEHSGDLYSCDHFVEPKYRWQSRRTCRVKNSI